MTSPAPLDMLGRAGLHRLSDALTKLQNHLELIDPLKAETIPLEKSLNRITAGTIHSPEDLPPYPRSTMDGYAVKGSETFGATDSMPVYLKVSGEVRMGELIANGPAIQECYKIATGGFIPPHTDSVIMLEHTISVDDNLIEVTKSVSPGENILAAGDDIKKDSVVVNKGHKLRPQDLGLLAGLGLTKTEVHGQVRVGFFSTGDEIVDYNKNPQPGKIRDMNGIYLTALVLQNKALPKYYGIVSDLENEFEQMLKKSLIENDLVLFSGSSSVGVRDMGERIINKIADPGILIHGVAIKPGKPIIVAFAQNKPIFGLPGHPVSTAIGFDLFVRPTILHLGGLSPSNLPLRPAVKAKLTRNLNSAGGRTDYIRVKVETSPDNTTFFAHPILGKSGALSTMVKADGYFVIEESAQGLCQGDNVEVTLFD